MSSSLTENELKVIKILREETSADKPISGKVLSIRVGMKSPAAAAVLIRSLHMKHYPICSHGKGYFYAHSGIELEKFINRLAMREKNLSQEILALREAFFNVDSFENNMNPKKVTYIRTFKIRKDRDTIAFVDFEVDANGKPINVPEGTEFV